MVREILWNGQTEIRIIGTRFTEIMKEGGFQDKAFLAWAKKNGLLGETEAGRNKKMCRIEGVDDPVRVVPLIVKDAGFEEKSDFISVSDDIEKELPWN